MQTKYISFFIIAIGIYLLSIDKTKTESIEIKTPIDSTKSISCRINELTPGFGFDYDVYRFLTSDCGMIYMTKEKYNEFESSGLFKILPKDSLVTIKYIHPSSSSEKIVQQLIYKGKSFGELPYRLEYKERVIKPSGIQLIGPYILIFSGMFFFLLFYVFQNETFNKIGELLLIAPSKQIQDSLLLLMR